MRVPVPQIGFPTHAWGLGERVKPGRMDKDELRTPHHTCSINRHSTVVRKSFLLRALQPAAAKPAAKNASRRRRRGIRHLSSYTFFSVRAKEEWQKGQPS